MLTHDSKATPCTRLMFAMTPFYARRPTAARRPPGGDGRHARGGLPGLGARRPDPRGVGTPKVDRAPGWVRDSPWLRPLARFWGEGVTKGPPLAVDERIFDWARTDPEGLRAAARAIAVGRTDRAGLGRAPGSGPTSTAGSATGRRGPARLADHVRAPQPPRGAGRGRRDPDQAPRRRPLGAAPGRLHRRRARSAGSSIETCSQENPDEPSGRDRVLRHQPRLRPPQPVGRGDQPDPGRRAR